MPSKTGAFHLYNFVWSIKYKTAATSPHPQPFSLREKGVKEPKSLFMRERRAG
jgi:hypothetical protein